MAQHGAASAALTADVDAYVAQISRLPGVTDKEVRAAALKYSSHLQKMQQANSRFSKQTQTEMTDAVEEITKVTDVVGKVPSVLNGAFGDALGPVGDFGDLMQMMGPWGAAAAVGLGVAGAAIAGVLTDLDRFRDNLDDLEGRKIVSAEQVRGVELASAALVTMGDRTEDLQAALAAKAAPAILNFVKGSAYAFTFLATLSGEVFDDIARSGATMWRALIERDFKWVKADFADLVDVSAEMEIATASAQVAVAEFMQDTVNESARARAAYVSDRNAEGDAIRERAAREREAAEARRAAAESKLEDQLTEARLRQMPVNQAVYIQAEQRIEQVRELARASGDLAAAEELILRIRADAVNQDSVSRQSERARLAQEEIEAATAAAADLQGGVSAAFAALEAEFADAGTNALREANALSQAMADMERAQRDRQVSLAASVISSTQSVIGSVAQLADANARNIAHVYGENSAQAKRAQMDAWRAQQAAGYASAVLSLPIAVAQAWTLPYPANLAAILAATAGVGAQIAAVASSPPPVMHGGGLADEGDTRLKRGELVLSAPQVDRAGGADQLRARIEQPAAGPMHVIVDFGDHQIVQSMARQIQRATRNPWLGVAP